MVAHVPPSRGMGLLAGVASLAELVEDRLDFMGLGCTLVPQFVAQFMCAPILPFFLLTQRVLGKLG